MPPFHWFHTAKTVYFYASKKRFVNVKQGVNIRALQAL